MAIDFQKRCTDCDNLKIKNGIYTCEECFGQLCADIDDCPLGITAEEVQTINTKAESVKIKHEAKSTKPKAQRAPRERKPDEEKEAIIKVLAETLENQQNITDVKVTNAAKIIEFNIGKNHYKLDLIKQRAEKGT